MTRRRRRLAAVGTAIVLAMLAVACDGSGEVTAPAAPAPATQPSTPAATATVPSRTATQTPATGPSPTATTAATPGEPGEEEESEFQIVTLLLPDAIPAIDDPRVISAEAASEQLRPADLVIGVSIDGEHRAYGAAFLSGHEIVNDTLGGRAIAVTW